METVLNINIVEQKLQYILLHTCLYQNSVTLVGITV